MSKTDENEIHHRLKLISQIEPTSEAADRAVQRVRDTLMNKEKRRESTSTRTWRTIFKRPIVKLPTAAVLLIGVGYATGWLLAPRPLDVEELQAALEPAIRRNLLEEIDRRWESALASRCAALKDELHQQVRRDLTEFAAQTLAASGTLTNQRLMELIQLIEATRRRERQQMEAAFEQIEQEKIQLRNGLLAVAAQTNELLGTKQ